MNMPGFNAEASIYRTPGHYYMAPTAIYKNGSVQPAQQNCPPWCIQDCIAGCQADGLSKTRCTMLCNQDCSAYGTGRPISCGPCIQNVQTCILCGGATTTRSCGLAVCGNQVCSPGAQCCGPHCCPPLCCPADTHCCSDGDGCCPDGSLCASFFGIHFCLPWLGGLRSGQAGDHVFASPRIGLAAAANSLQVAG